MVSMVERRLIHLSKTMSLMLRHEPERFGIVLDPEGFASLDEVVAALAAENPGTSVEDVKEVVETIEPDKQRFSIVDGEIRANYGHSLSDRIVHEPAAPPAVLYHGTAERFVEAIRRLGLKPMRRQYVHLTIDAGLARRVGGRHGKPQVLRVDAAAAHAEGVRFYRANERFWLADEVQSRFVGAIEG